MAADIAEISEISSILSIFTVVLCFSAMAIFIIRLGINPLPVSSQPVGEDVPVTAMVGMRNPFSLEIFNTDSAALNSGVKLKVSSEVPCTLDVYWGLNISSLYNVFTHRQQSSEAQSQDCSAPVSLCQNDPVEYPFDCIWSVSRLEVHLFDTKVTKIPIKEDKSISLDVCQGEVIELKPVNQQLNLGGLPRTKYPLVVVMSVDATQDSDIQEEEQSNIVSMVSAIHLPDSGYSVKSHIILQMVFTNTGSCCNLEKFFVSTEQSEDSTSAETLDPNIFAELETEDLPAGARDCTVCQNASISRVLLPCRHACVCDHCFPLLDKCPMCRGPIQSFFYMHGNQTFDEYDDMDDLDSEEEMLSWMAKFERACERLNRWLGLTQ
ncbi:cell growth regulator with RING finger domain protein 1-like [Glandiceps talaboti]